MKNFYRSKIIVFVLPLSFLIFLLPLLHKNIFQKLTKFFSFDAASAQVIPSLSSFSWTDGRVGSHALVFDSSRENYLQIENTASLDFSVADFSVSLWFKTSTPPLSGTAPLITKNSWRVNMNSSGQIQFLAGTDCNPGSTAGYADGLWHQLAVVRNHATSRCLLYIDGGFVDDAAFTTQISSNQNNITVGGSTVPDTYFNGALDDIRLYSKSLTAADISFIYINSSLWQYCQSGDYCGSGKYCDGSGIYAQSDLCDACTDADADGICTDADVSADNPCSSGQTEFCDDNCPEIYNPGQEDSNSDGVGDACDFCPGDSTGDPDGDKICGDHDNCPTVYNPVQTDSDNDGRGDICDVCPQLAFDSGTDTDDDTIGDQCDNCPDVFNIDQADFNNDGFGDGCSSCITVDALSEWSGVGIENLRVNLDKTENIVGCRSDFVDSGSPCYYTEHCPAHEYCKFVNYGQPGTCTDFYNCADDTGGILLSRVLPTPYIWLAASSWNQVWGISIESFCVGGSNDGQNCTEYPSICGTGSLCLAGADSGMPGYSSPPYRNVIATDINPSRTAVDLENKRAYVVTRSAALYELTVIDYDDIFNPVVRHCDTQSSNNCARGVVIDQEGMVWVGQCDGWLKKINPDNCNILETFSTYVAGDPYNQAYAIYGMAIDSEGNIWLNDSSPEPGSYIKKVQTTPTVALERKIYLSGGYGIAVDLNDKVWVGGFTTANIFEIDPVTYSVTSHPTPNCPTQGITGIAVDLDNNVWGSCYYDHKSIRLNTHITPYMQTVTSLSSDLITNPHGVAADSYGYVWHVGRYSNSFIGLKNNDPTQKKGAFGTGLQPYTYSDMTGVNRGMIFRTGFWTGIYDSGVNGKVWHTLRWESEIQDPLNMEFDLCLRLTDTVDVSGIPDFSGENQTCLSSESLSYCGSGCIYLNDPQDPSPAFTGRFLEAEIKLRSTIRELSPYVGKLNFCYYDPTVQCQDDDNDGYGNPGTNLSYCAFDIADNCPDFSNPFQTDTDDDGIGDSCDTCQDIDRDGYGTGTDISGCPLSTIDADCDDTLDNCNINCSSDGDSDGSPDCRDFCTDIDSDGYGSNDIVAGPRPMNCISGGDVLDNCSDVWNDTQTDTDEDGFGDLCDPCIDTDKDGYGIGQCLGDDCDLSDPDCNIDCASDTDTDSIIDCRDDDIDGDTILNINDNCPLNDNPLQEDSDNDSIGDTCDNCPATANRYQEDADGDGTGDACEN
ncbi:hypothetical protein C4572_02550 [Candidatus Parcubacteria bacterium]|nr:MAG: hypothetical protein C4572_02550 [Candidatus Parcubacteria bacterium]